MVAAVVSALERVLEWMIVALLATMVVLVFGNVVLRFGFHSGIPSSEELSRYAFVWLTFTAAALTLREGSHLGMDFLVRRLGSAGRKACRVASNLVMALCCGLFIVGSWHQTLGMMGSHAQASGFPMAAVFAVGLVMGGIMLLVILGDLVLLATGQLDDATPTQALSE